MSIFNPWAEVRRLKAQLEAGYETYRVEETQQQAEWAKKAVLLEELERINTILRRENYDMLKRVAELKKKEARLLKLERDNFDLITELAVRGHVIEQRNNDIKSLKEQLAKAVDPRDPKTGRFTKKAK